MFRHLFRYEHRSEPLLPWRVFLIRRIGRTLAVCSVVVVASLFIGMLGYRLTEGMGWLDAFLNASMILGGMGPVDVLTSDGAKIFAGAYALFSGVFFLVIAGVIIAPFLHRVLHRLHVDTGDSSDDKDSK